MGRIIAVANQKGRGWKVYHSNQFVFMSCGTGEEGLTIDIDPQGNTTSGFGVDKNSVENTLYELLLGQAETKIQSSKML